MSEEKKTEDLFEIVVKNKETGEENSLGEFDKYMVVGNSDGEPIVSMKASSEDAARFLEMLRAQLFVVPVVRAVIEDEVKKSKSRIQVARELPKIKY